MDLEFQIGSVLYCFGGFFTRSVTSFNVGCSSVMVSVFLETDKIGEDVLVPCGVNPNRVSFELSSPSADDMDGA